MVDIKQIAIVYGYTFHSVERKAYKTCVINDPLGQTHCLVQ